MHHLILQSPTIEREAQSGFALVAVLGLVLIVSAILLPFTTSARLRLLTAENALNTYRYEQIGEVAAVEAARTLTGQSDAGLFGHPKPRPYADCKVGEYTLSLQVQDHRGLIDLNAASLELLGVGFQALGLSTEKAKLLARAVDLYRRLDQQPALELASLIGPSGYKHAAFEDVAELKDFVDLKQVSLLAITGVFTVYNYSGSLVVNLAPSSLKTIIKSQQKSAVPSVSLDARARALTVALSIHRRASFVALTGATVQLTGNRVYYVTALKRGEEENEEALLAQSVNCPEILGPSLLASLEEALN